MLREAFYYLLGGVTFLPLCILGIVLHFYLNAPSVRQTNPPSVDADIELTHEQKLAALDLAARNAAIHAEIENAKGKDHPQGDTTAPPTAKRLGPGPANSSAPKPFSSGWLTVRPTFHTEKDVAAANNGIASPATIPASLVDSESDVSRLRSDDEGTAADNSDAASITSTKSSVAGSGYMSQMYRGILDYRIGRGASKKPPGDATNSRSAPGSSASGATPAGSSGTSGKGSFYCILKSPILYIYSSDETASPNTECHAAIDLRGKRVSIFVAGLGDTLGELDPEQHSTTQHDNITDDEQLGDAAADQQAFDPKQAWKKAKRAVVRDGELFLKRNAIRIVGSAPGGDRKGGRPLNRRRPQWFIFCKNNYIMEDWYHDLLQASLVPESGLATKLPEDGPVDPLARLLGKLDNPIGPTFSEEDMASLLVSLDSLPDPLPLRWLNALIGRIFFSVYRTAWLEDYITSKMMKQLHRVKTPGFLGDIKVEEVDVGRRAPGFSRPMLKALTTDGVASMEIAVHYLGEVRITISTTLTLSLGSRFKPYNIPIVLAVVLRSLEGNLLLHVKKPPSNRLWFGFTTMPKMEIDIEPVVSERKVQWGMVTRLIESRLRELLQESIVVPNMDDVSFFDTRSLPLRGGIFADAAKKADLARTEVDVSSAPASAALDTGSTQQEHEIKNTSTSLKASDLLTANKVGTASAPVSGTATPVMPDRSSASFQRDGATVEDGRASSVNSGAGATFNNALRNRKGGAEASSALREPSLQAVRTTSPAAAGLSELLNRDLAAGGGGLSGSPPRLDAQGNKRRTWFGSGPKSSVSSIGSSSGLSSLGLGAASIGGKSGREQSSLALGNASIERPSQLSHSTSVYGRSDSSLPVPGGISTRAVSDSASGTVDRSKTRASVLSTDDSDAEAHRTQDAARAASLAAATLQRERSSEAKQEHPAGTPSLIVSSASEPVLAFGDADSSAAHSHDARSTLEAPSPHDGDGERDLVDSPSSLTHSARSSLRSSRSDVVLPDANRDIQGNDGESIKDGKAEGFEDTGFFLASRQMSRGSEGAEAAAAAALQQAMPPPPPRRPTSEQRSVPRQDAASALSSVQRSRYGLNEADRSPGDNALTGTTSTMLLTSWNKAKASMADKEARQAAARDAKDAIKRGWANWNTKRAEAKRAVLAEDEFSQLTRSQSSRLSLVPGKSAWLASSPPDPTSFGLGFDKSSPEDTRSAFRDKHASSGHHATVRSNLTDTDDDNASVHSNSSNRQPYREVRASKKVHGFDNGLADGRASSVPSSKLASSAALSTISSTLTAVDTSDWPAKRDADILSLTPPAPADHEEEGNDSKRSKTLDRTTSNDAHTFASMPPVLPQRKSSSSISSTGQSGVVVSFIPPAPTATTKFASPSGLSAGDDARAETEAGLEAQLAGANGGGDDLLASVASTQPRTPERTTLSQDDKSPSRTQAQVSKPFVAQKDDRSAGEEREAVAPTTVTPITQPTSETARLSEPAKEMAASEQTQPMGAAESSSTEKSTPKSDQPYAALPPPEAASPSLGSGIKKQPGRATMMAVPGIPSMQKAGPQSFSAPPPSEPLPANPETSPSAFKASSLFKLPSFGSPVLTSGGLKSVGSAMSPSNSGEGVSSAAGITESAARVPPPVPARPGVEDKTKKTATTSLGLIRMVSSDGMAGLTGKSPSKDSKLHHAGDTTGPFTESKVQVEPSQPEDGDGTQVSTPFAEIVKARDPAANPEFEHAQVDLGDMVQIGNKEVQIPSKGESEARPNEIPSE